MGEPTREVPFVDGAPREEMPAGLWESMKILSLDMTETTASAKVTMTMPTVRWVDYLSLVKIDGRWWIVNKVFHGYPVEG